MRPVNQQVTIEARHRTLLTLWFALTVAIGMYFLLTFLTPPVEGARENPVLSLTFLVVGMLAVIASFFIKRRFLARSVNEQDVRLVHTGVILAAALSESAAIFGVVDYLLTGHRHYYLLMIVALIGISLNFPRRSYLEAASYKGSQPKDPWK